MRPQLIGPFMLALVTMATPAAGQGVTEVTVTDPMNFARSWSVMMPLNRDEGYLMIEYACHEGNYALPNELRGWRALNP